ncbi:unnamed protein product [Pedinophyceae sp. YPF-701]|nr:unnamed protein product [Pedinophyceae sp. YPF-701]
MAGGRPPLLSPGDLIGEEPEPGRYEVVAKIGEGQFAEVYEARDRRQNDAHVAVKLERPSASGVVKVEAATLQALAGTPRNAAYRGEGTHAGLYYIAMDLYGKNITQARKDNVLPTLQGDGAPRLAWDVVAPIGRSMLAALRALHDRGWISRDVKPANFCLEHPAVPPPTHAVVLIDLGLARRYREDDGKHVARRPSASFRGSSVYASASALAGGDMGRRDDLWSLLYILVELVTGSLPWRAAARAAASERQARAAIRSQKRACIEDPEKLFGGAPVVEALVGVSRCLEALAFEDTPDYDRIDELLGGKRRAPAPGPGSDGAQRDAKRRRAVSPSPPRRVTGGSEPAQPPPDEIDDRAPARRPREPAPADPKPPGPLPWYAGMSGAATVDVDARTGPKSRRQWKRKLVDLEPPPDAPADTVPAIRQSAVARQPAPHQTLGGLDVHMCKRIGVAADRRLLVEHPGAEEPLDVLAATPRQEDALMAVMAYLNDLVGNTSTASLPCLALWLGTVADYALSCEMRARNRLYKDGQRVRRTGSGGVSRQQSWASGGDAGGRGPVLEWAGMVGRDDAGRRAGSPPGYRGAPGGDRRGGYDDRAYTSPV